MSWRGSGWGCEDDEGYCICVQFDIVWTLRHIFALSSWPAFSLWQGWSYMGRPAAPGVTDWGMLTLVRLLAGLWHADCLLTPLLWLRVRPEPFAAGK
jgi:hypothetical protein